MDKLPLKFKENMQALLKEDYLAYLDSFSHERYYGLRVNTSKITVADFLKITPFKLTPIPWCQDGFYYDENAKVTKHPYYYAGLYYIQEPSAMLPAEVLNIKEDDVVLDGCAAPGGKSCKLANKLNNTGLLISNDISASRCQGLLKNIELFGIKKAIVCSEDLTKLPSKVGCVFNKILIDAPCSGEGMFRKDSSLINSWLNKGNDYYSKIQKDIVASALEMLVEGGQLVYSTCTFNKSENEEVLAYMQSLCPTLKLLDIKYVEGFQEGLDGFKKAVRLYPHKLHGEGHFVALLQKGEIASKPLTLPKYQPDLTLIDDFFKLVNSDSLTGIVETINDKVILSTGFKVQSLRMLSNGLLLGTSKKGVFEPSTALALALKKDEFKQVIDLSVNDERVIRYLKGETIDVKEFNYEGWVLICVDSFPLGFGKISGGVFKNKYERNWRYV